MATASISTVAARKKLKPRRDPYFHKLTSGVYIGFRKMQAGTDGTWSIRMRDDATGKQVHKALGTLDEHPDFERFDRAVEQSKEWVEHAKAGGITTPKTIADACSFYVEHLRLGGSGKPARPASADDAAKRFQRIVLDDAKFASLELTKLKPVHIQQWHKRLASKPVLRGSGRGNNPSKDTGMIRSASSMNRDMTTFRAALNHAFVKQWVTSDFAWKSELRPIAGAGNRRDLYLDRSQRMALLEAAIQGGSGIAPFIRCISALPVRPGALAKLKVSDFDQRTNELSITSDKTGARRIALPNIIASIFKDQCKNKLPSAPIFSKADGSPWNKDAWKGPVKDAVLAAGLPDQAVMYSLRHSAITDLIINGVDPLTVSRLSGTSLMMIQKHYGHLQAAAAEAAIASVAI